MTPTRKSPKQANGEAKPYYKPSKQRWIGPYTVDGVRHEITGTDEATVRARWADKQLEIAVAARTGVAVVDDRLTVGRLFDSWIAGDCPSFGKRNDPTVAGIATATRLLNDHLRPALGNVAIRDLKPSIVTALFKRMAAERTVRAPNGYADTTLVRLRGILDRVLQYAEAEGTAMPPAARTAARNARIPNDAHGVTVERRSLSRAEVAKVLEVFAGHVYESAVTVMAYTGLRPAELMGLTWGSIDLGAGTLTVEATAVERGGRWIRQEHVKSDA